MHRVNLLVPVLLFWAMALWLAPSALAQNNASGDVTVQLESAFPAPIRPGVQGTITVRVKNSLQQRPPIELQATATYVDSSGVQRVVTSNKVVIQVVQPVTVSQISLQLPSNWVVGGGITLPLNLDVTLLEQQEHTVNIPVTVR